VQAAVPPHQLERTAQRPAAAGTWRRAGITKRFGALVANDGISLDAARGEVLALLGENGAGKSTLVSILFGHYVADAGHIEVDGQPLPPGNPARRWPPASAWCTSTSRWPTT
jgi:ABC-type sugar transport system ATPase subunit